MFLGKQKSARKLTKDELYDQYYEETHIAFLKRMDYICGKMMAALGVNIEARHNQNVWFIESLPHEYDGLVGYFDSQKHYAYIGIKFLIPKTANTELFEFALEHFPYICKIPTSWLLQDFEETLETSINNLIQKNRNGI